MTIYYVRASGGSNANDGLSFANGWATLAYATNTGGTGFASLAPGDRIRFCADAEYVLTTAFVPGTTGAEGNPIIVEGANATGTVDGTKPVIRPTTGAVAALLAVAASITDWEFHYLDFRGRDTGGTKRCTNCYTSAAANSATRWKFSDCDFSGATGNNTTLRSQNTQFVRCTSTDSGAAGFGSNSATDPVFYVDCESYGNTGDGFQCGVAATSTVANCKSYGNGGYGINSSSGAATFLATILSNTCYDNDLGGLRIASGNPTVSFSLGLIADNTFVSNGAPGVILSGSGVTTSANVRALLAGFRRNHAHGNTGGAASFDPSIINWEDINSGNIEGDPLFADAANGDFTPTTGSPLIGAGIGGHDIGAVKYEPAGGGGAALQLIGAGGLVF